MHTPDPRDLSKLPPTFVVGDLHGCAAELRLLLEQLPITPECTVVFVGDYYDRGPDARGVIDTILELRQRTNVVPLMGNHEAMFLDYQVDPRSTRGGMFIYNGGSSTLASYADDHGNVEIPAAHIAFIEELQLIYETPRWFITHAGAPECPLEEVDPDDDRMSLLWSRQMSQTDYVWSKLVVHGHSPVQRPDVQHNHVNIDTGCVYGNTLSAVELNSMTTISVPRQHPDHPPRYLRDMHSRRRAIRFEGSIPVSIMFKGHPLQFLTVNFSEIGMYLRSLSDYTSVRLREHDIVRGKIGVAGPWQVSYQGRVVRVDEREGGLYYAVDIERTDLP